MNQLAQLQAELLQSVTIPKEKQAFFFKTGAGHYSEHDTFMGVTNPTLRTLAKKYATLPLEDIQTLITSPVNEVRLLALLIAIHQYQKPTLHTKDEIYHFYVRNIPYVNNWNLVDASAHLILGAHIDTTNKNILFSLAQSNSLWERRIAIVATWHFIRKNELELTTTIAAMLLKDSHDLIHKAVGWMLREAGKRNQQVLIQFLDTYSTDMPRTMLRYSIERLPEQLRKHYLHKTKS
jgi:3-methyladenine DNA glycosylase AlkD